MRISARLLAIADMLEGASSVADIGCDHGKLSVYLNKRGFKVIATDESDAAVTKVTRLALRTKADVDVRKGDGLRVIASGETDACVIAGLGGREILKIMLDDPDVARSFGCMVLQPMQRQGELREGLTAAKFTIERDEIVEDAGRIFEIIRVKSGEPREIPEWWPPDFFELGWQSVSAGDPLAQRLVARRVKELEARIAEASRGASPEARNSLEKRLEQYRQVEKLYEVTRFF